MKKKTVPPRKARRAPAAPKALRLEVGKTYITRDGKHKARITKVYNPQSDWPFWGEWIGREPAKGPDRCTVPYWAENGRIYSDDSDEPTDLVREIPGAKRPGAKRRGPKSSSKKGSAQ